MAENEAVRTSFIWQMENRQLIIIFIYYRLRTNVLIKVPQKRLM